jgi:hypothetical protein
MNQLNQRLPPASADPDGPTTTAEMQRRIAAPARKRQGTRMTTTNSPKYQIGDIVCWQHDSERVATGTIVSQKAGPRYHVEIHFNPGLEFEMSEDELHPVHPEILQEILEALQAAIDCERMSSGRRRLICG